MAEGGGAGTAARGKEGAVTVRAEGIEEAGAAATPSPAASCNPGSKGCMDDGDVMAVGEINEDSAPRSRLACGTVAEVPNKADTRLVEEEDDAAEEVELLGGGGGSVGAAAVFRASRAVAGVIWPVFTSDNRSGLANN